MLKRKKIFSFSGLGGVSALGTLANTQAFQAANLSGLLGNGLGGADLSSLVQNPLASQTSATQQQLAALAAQNSSNMSSINGLNFNRPSGNDSFSTPSNYSSNNMGGSNTSRFQSSMGGGSTGGYGSSSSMMRPSMEGKSFSRKVLVSNVSKICFKFNSCESSK